MHSCIPKLELTHFTHSYSSLSLHWHVCVQGCSWSGGFYAPQPNPGLSSLDGMIVQGPDHRQVAMAMADV